jgi:HSP20 family protein
MFLVPMTRRSNDLAQFSRLFDETFERFFQGAPAGDAAPAAVSPALDVTDTPQAWLVKLDVPGVAKEDVKVSIDGSQVSIEAQLRKDDEKKEGERVIYRERSVTRFARSFTLPAEVDQSESGAKLENGVLTLTLAKKRAVQSTQLQIN